MTCFCDPNRAEPEQTHPPIFEMSFRNEGTTGRRATTQDFLQGARPEASPCPPWSCSHRGLNVHSANQHETWKGALRRGQWSIKGPFSGSMLVWQCILSM